MVDNSKLSRNFPVPDGNASAEGLGHPVPPPFGAKQAPLIRRYGWIELITSAPQELGTGNISFARGRCALDQKYHVPYWTFVEQLLKAKVAYTEANLQPPWPYLLCDDNRLWIGLGFLAAGEDVNDFAHLCCWFLERGKTVQLMPPQEVRLLTARIDENYHFAMLGIDDNGDVSGADANEGDGAHPGSSSEDSKRPDSNLPDPLPSSAATALREEKGPRS